MTTTDTRIAELLGWAKYSGSDGRYTPPDCKRRQHVQPNFTTDLNLTVREIERKGWVFDFACYTRSGGAQIYYGCDVYPFRPPDDSDVYGSSESTSPAEALALAFLAALEAEKEGDQ